MPVPRPGEAAVALITGVTRGRARVQQLLPQAGRVSSSEPEVATVGGATGGEQADAGRSSSASGPSSLVLLGDQLAKTVGKPTGAAQPAVLFEPGTCLSGLSAGRPPRWSLPVGEQHAGISGFVFSVAARASVVRSTHLTHISSRVEESSCTISCAAAPNGGSKQRVAGDRLGSDGEINRDIAST